VAALVDVADKEHASWLTQALSRPPVNADALVDFLVGATHQGLPINPDFYGCMQHHHQVCVLDATQRASAFNKHSCKLPACGM